MNAKLRRSGYWSWILSLALLALAPAYGLELTPMLSEFAPAGAGATRAYELINDSDRPIALEISMAARAVDLDGNETLTDAGDDFLVYPDQFILGPGARQMVRVTWVGDPAPVRELPFRFIAEQLPVDELGNAVLKGARGRVQIVVRFVGSAYVRPAKADPRPVLESAVARETPGQPPRLELVLANQGAGRAVLMNFELRLTSPGSGKSVTLGPKDLEALQETTIQAGGRRRFLVPWPQGLPPGPVEASFKLLGKR